MADSFLYNEAVEYYNKEQYLEAYKIWSKMTDDSDALYFAAYILYKHNIGVEKRWNTAFNLFKASSELGNHKSTFYCGYLLEKVFGEKYYDSAFDYYYKALINEVENSLDGIKRLASLGGKTAQAFLGWAYRCGQYGFEKNYDMAEKWSILAFENGERYDAPEQLAWIYKANNDYSKALSFFKIAAEEGNDSVYGPIGDLYRWGRYGVRKNYTEALRWYDKGAETGHEDASFFLGYMHLKGMGCKKNKEKALQCFDAVVNGNDPQSICNLATVYYEGVEGIHDPHYAIKLLEKADMKGNTNASVLLGVILYEGENIIQDYAKAFELFEKAESNPRAQEYLGLCYCFGHGCKKNETLAKHYFLKSFRNGNKSASKYLTNDLDLKPYSKWDMNEKGAEIIGGAVSFIFGAILSSFGNND